MTAPEPVEPMSRECQACHDTGSTIYEGGLEQCTACWVGPDTPAPEPVEVQIHLPDEPRRDWPLEARLNGVVGRYAWNAEDQTWEGARAATTWPKIVARCLAWEFDLYSVPPTSGVAA